MYPIGFGSVEGRCQSARWASKPARSVMKRSSPAASISRYHANWPWVWAQACEALRPGGLPITQARGKWLDFEGIPLMPTFHPNYLLHNPSATVKRTAWEDILLVMEKVGLPISDKQRGFFAAK